MKPLLKQATRSWRAAGVLLCLFGMPAAYALPWNSSALDKTGYLDLYKQTAYYQIQVGSRMAEEGHYDKALPHFQKAAEMNPSSVMAQYNLGYSLMVTAEGTVTTAEKDTLLEKAEWAFLRTRDLNPDLSLSYFKLGKLALARQDFKTACDYYESGVEANPDNAALWFNLGAAYEKVNNVKRAEKAYLKAIENNPQFVYAYNNLGLIYEQAQHLDQAEAMYRKALAEVPEYNFARLNLGSMLQGQGRLDEAQILYKEAIQYEPKNAWAYLYLGNVYYRKGSYQDALNAYEQAISLNPEYPTTYYLASLALQKLNRVDEALEDGLHYINLAPNGAFSQEANDMVLTLQHVKKKNNTAAQPQP